ncbi:MAG: hypothetical protein ACD_49C00026G0014 [uncultured bacterium (gcode 4)]|uniref:Uncharacterized protein n=1 Tax=uncultured bacterium (gcode 4) TaxID=1234023 RepID=K2BWW5_9BACT|nr:MAG: hypothetical protein ACD_49C00026G0014 [uncultured bacterium (gcode 4)]
MDNLYTLCNSNLQIPNKWDDNTSALNDNIFQERILWLLEYNSYWREKYNIDNLDLYRQEIIWKFLDLLQKYWFWRIDEVFLWSWVDESVIFIGSHISVLKPYFLSWNFDWVNWYFMQQECLRTHNLKNLFDDSIIPKWWSCFTSLWSISKPDWWLEKSCEFILDYLINWLQIPLENILIRISSEDQDLLQALQLLWYKWKIEFDSKPKGYYRHKLWLWEITWRNFNIALRHWNDDIFNDIWNIILIEDNKKIYTTEIALWLNTILLELYWLNNIFQTTNIEKYYNINSWLHPKLKDCIISSIHLLNEWIKPIASNNKWRILRKYMRWILYFIKKLWLNLDQILEICKNYEQDTFWTNNCLILIKEYILSYENDLLNKADLSDEDKIIKILL